MGSYFQAEAERVHAMIVTVAQGEHGESRIKSIDKYHNGCCDIVALRMHYAGQGNVTCRIGSTKRT